MEVAGTSGAPQTVRTPTDETARKAMLDYDNFLQLLVAQMKNQDPTEPMDATQQLAQLATFSQVEQTIQTNQKLEMLMQSSALSEADAVIGRTITSANGAVSGVVKEVVIRSDGITAILDSGEELAVTAGIKVS